MRKGEEEGGKGKGDQRKVPRKSQQDKKCPYNLLHLQKKNTQPKGGQEKKRVKNETTMTSLGLWRRENRVDNQEMGVTTALHIAGGGGGREG